MEQGRRHQDHEQHAERGGQRLDKWLWYARVVKSRGLAARLVGEGHVRVNGTRMAIPARPVRPGDVLTIALEHQVLVLKVLDCGERRGPFVEARRLYADLGGCEDTPSRETSKP